MFVDVLQVVVAVPKMVPTLEVVIDASEMDCTCKLAVMAASNQAGLAAVVA